ncbi:MAG: hypothetical protein HRU38_09080 [Saccharospirillaceae bacterium]|nr:hypothetical protein [Pseudomonadales bacterium]NRB78807.1 hypothetical protein [Saccharospirillaceae bacterium]
MKLDENVTVVILSETVSSFTFREGIMITTKIITIETSSDKIWQIFAHDFDNAYKWMASVPNSVGHDNGKKYEGSSSAGRVCELDGNPKGMKAKESFLAYDEENKTCTVLIEFLNTPFGFPIVQNVAKFSLTQTSTKQSEVTFSVTSTLKPLAFIIYPIIKFGFGFFIKQIVEELKFYVENDTPHPRKIKAINKMKLTTKEQN